MDDAHPEVERGAQPLRHPLRSKWNPIEHRVFGPITINWSGEPLTSLNSMLSLIRRTTTQTGLTVTAVRKTKTYPLHVKVSNAEFNSLNQ